MPTNNADQITTTTPDERTELVKDILFLLDRLSIKSLRKVREVVAWIYEEKL